MKHVLGGVAHWRHLQNTIEQSMCGGDAACCQLLWLLVLYWWIHWATDSKRQ